MVDDGNINMEGGSKELESHNSATRVCGTTRRLDADMLVEVFSYLPQQELFEVMLVSREWENAVIHGSALWRTVNVVRKWDVEARGVEGMVGIEEGRGPGSLLDVLRLGEVVTFSSAFDHAKKHIMSVGGALGSKLRELELPHNCCPPAFLTTLESNCRQLKMLVIKGEPMSEVPICICHLALETLHFEHKTCQPLTLSCPNLTSLGIRGGDATDLRQTCRPETPYSFDCPKLMKAKLLDMHSLPELLKAIALCAPHVALVQVSWGSESPYHALTQFGSLKNLFLHSVDSDIPSLALQWPHLETLHLSGYQYAQDLAVRHSSLRELTIVDWWSPISPRLSCPSLEALVVRSTQVDRGFLGTLHGSCPSLKKFEIDGHYYVGGPKGPLLPLDFLHNVVQKLTLVGVYYSPIHITCAKLSELVIIRTFAEVTEMELEVECPNLTTFRISRCFIERYLPSFLLALPSLKYLDISEANQRSEVILAHSQIEDVVIRCSMLKEVILVMPRLVRVCVKASEVRMLQVIASETVTILYSSRSVVRQIKVTREEMVNFYSFENLEGSQEGEEGW